MPSSNNRPTKHLRSPNTHEVGPRAWTATPSPLPRGRGRGEGCRPKVPDEVGFLIVWKRWLETKPSFPFNKEGTVFGLIPSQPPP
jgi:hypothetical protein